VTLETTGSPVALPATADVTAYRIIQEALTNAARHAPGAAVTIRIGYEPGDVLIDVIDTGSPGPMPVTVGTRLHRAGNGTGITGMRDRASALGGDLEAGPHAERGFRVAARLPLESRA
jgi:signal transduction histidine kinase